MSRACRLGFCLLPFLAFAPLVHAGSLQWDQTVVSKTAAPGDQKLELVFPFTNTGKERVDILDVKPSCSCTTADTPKKFYEPGEKGEVKAVFTVGKQKGHEEKTILVKTSEKDISPYVLTLKIDIPEPVKINKQTLTWQVGDPLESQSFEVTVSDPKAAQILGVRTFSKEFNLMLEEVEAGKTYRISVTPVSTDKPVRGTVLLYITDPEKRTISLPVAVE